ncbi:MAG TPA: PilZ domain-containing protein [Lacunisphaera sp.]|nr:PilZ domain-containing protein [Lacunisphaera sp.]
MNREFPLQSVLNIAGRDSHGQPLRPTDREGWDWPGLLVDLSSKGARLQVPLTVAVHRDDTGRLHLDVQGYKLSIPCRVAHITECRDSYVLGLDLDLQKAGTQAAYYQLMDLIALGSSLRLVKSAQPDQSGYLLEQYAGEPASHLSIWRHQEGREVAAFEFVLKDCFVRGVADSNELECFSGKNATAPTTSQAQWEEIHRLYQWVVLNLAATVPADARAFLLRLAI